MYYAVNLKKISGDLKFFLFYQHILMNEEENIGFSITSDYDSITTEEVFKPLLKVLMAYSHKLIGNGTLRLTKNRDELAYDFSMEAIQRYLENPDKFDPSRNSDLVKYLKFNILKRLISNFKELKGQQNECIFEDDDSIGMSVSKSFIKENDVHDLIDLENIIQQIQKELIDNPILLSLFNLRYISDYTRAEVCTELEISNGEYNNRIRRLDTVLNRVKKNQQI